MKSLRQQIRACAPRLHDDANLMSLRDFIDALQVLDAKKSDGERLVEIREDCPEEGTYAVRLLERDQEEETE